MLGGEGKKIGNGESQSRNSDSGTPKPVSFFKKTGTGNGDGEISEKIAKSPSPAKKSGTGSFGENISNRLAIFSPKFDGGFFEHLVYLMTRDSEFHNVLFIEQNQDITMRDNGSNNTRQ